MPSDPTPDPPQDVSANGYVVGVDYGTLSARAVVVRAADGAELGSAVHDYAHAVIDRTLPATGEELPRDWALQDPQDYIAQRLNEVEASCQAFLTHLVNPPSGPFSSNMPPRAFLPIMLLTATIAS